MRLHSEETLHLKEIKVRVEDDEWDDLCLFGMSMWLTTHLCIRASLTALPRRPVFLPAIVCTLESICRAKLVRK